MFLEFNFTIKNIWDGNLNDFFISHRALVPIDDDEPAKLDEVPGVGSEKDTSGFKKTSSSSSWVGARSI